MFEEKVTNVILVAYNDTIEVLCKPVSVIRICATPFLNLFPKIVLVFFEYFEYFVLICKASSFTLFTAGSTSFSNARSSLKDALTRHVVLSWIFSLGRDFSFRLYAFSDNWLFVHAVYLLRSFSPQTSLVLRREIVRNFIEEVEQRVHIPCTNKSTIVYRVVGSEHAPFGGEEFNKFDRLGYYLFGIFTLLSIFI